MPLQYRQAKNGVVVYSVYSIEIKNEYKGQNIDNPDPLVSLPFVEFRLWNINQRNLPAKK